MTWADETTVATNSREDYVYCKWCNRLILPTIANCDSCGGAQ